MFIGSNSPVAGTSGIDQQEIQSAKRGPSSGSKVEDRTRFFATREQTLKFRSDLNRLPESRTARIAEVRKAIADGSFQVSDEQIADAIAGEYSR